MEIVSSLLIVIKSNLNTVSHLSLMIYSITYLDVKMRLQGSVWSKIISFEGNRQRQWWRHWQYYRCSWHKLSRQVHLDVNCVHRRPLAALPFSLTTCHCLRNSFKYVYVQWTRSLLNSDWRACEEPSAKVCRSHTLLLEHCTDFYFILNRYVNPLTVLLLIFVFGLTVYKIV